MRSRPPPADAPLPAPQRNEGPRGADGARVCTVSLPYPGKVRASTHQFFHIPTLCPCDTRYIGYTPLRALSELGSSWTQGKHQNSGSWAGFRVSGITSAAVMFIAFGAILLAIWPLEKQRTHWWAAIDVLPEPRYIHGVPVAGHEFSEFTSPYLMQIPREYITMAYESKDAAAALKTAFQAKYPCSPRHPDRAAETPTFVRDRARLITQLACVHAIYLLRARLATCAREAEETFCQEACLLATHSFLHAWVDVPPLDNARLSQIPTWHDSPSQLGAVNWGPDADTDPAPATGWGGNGGWGASHSGWDASNDDEWDQRWAQGWNTGWGSAAWTRLQRSRLQSHRVRHGYRNMARTFRAPRTIRRRKPTVLDHACRQYHRSLRVS
ncbi:hypothetical protein DFH09DRAFT_1068448 [Mycena vulgaris]|nr:hypothetical protein DFH09DRAFT_1068448 [Mycena vulgaris]